MSACNGSQPIVDTTPVWYGQNRLDTQDFLYGFGDGYSEQDAKAMALNTISQNIAVTVSGEMTKKTYITQNDFSDKTAINLKLELSKITFQNPVIEKKELVSNHYYLLVKVSKPELIKTVLSSLTNEDNIIKKEYASGSVLPKLESIFALQQLSEKLPSALSKANILSGLLAGSGSNFNFAAYADRYSSYVTGLTLLKQNVSFVIISSPTSKEFTNELASFLNKNGYKEDNKKYDAKVEINTNAKYNRAGAWFIAKVSTNIKVHSNNKVINSFTMENIGRSSLSDKHAFADASIDFKSELERKGIKSLLFR